MSRWYDRRALRTGVHIGLAILLVTTAVFAAGVEYRYVTEPRDQATDWIVTNTDENATIEVYENSIADVGIPHGRDTSHYSFPEERATNSSSLVLNETAYTKWMLDMPNRQPKYIQLTSAEFRYLDPEDPRSEQFSERRTFIRKLLNGGYSYRVVAEFGTPPVYSNSSLIDRFARDATRPAVEGSAEIIVILEYDDGTNTTEL